MLVSKVYFRWVNRLTCLFMIFWLFIIFVSYKSMLVITNCVFHFYLSWNFIAKCIFNLQLSFFAESIDPLDIPLLLKALRWPKVLSVNPALDVTRLVLLKPGCESVLGEANVGELVDLVIRYICSINIFHMLLSIGANLLNNTFFAILHPLVGR